MEKIIAIGEVKPATRKEIRKRLILYEKDLKSCMADLKNLRGRKPSNISSDDANMLNKECENRIAYYGPVIKELKWVLGIR